MADHTFVTGQFVRIDQTLANAGDRAVAALLDLIVVVMIASSLSMLLLPLWDEGELQFAALQFPVGMADEGTNAG